MRSKLCGALAATLLCVCPALAVDWAPIDAETLSIEKPRIDPEADAEALFWDVWMSRRQVSSGAQKVKTEYLRIKIFTPKGVKTHSTIDLSSGPFGRIRDLRGRTIKPDGRIIELQKVDVFERVAAKLDGLKVRVHSFSMPNVEPGDIIEYQWRELEDSFFSPDLRLQFQREIPVRRITYHVKPSAPFGGLSMQTQSFRAENSPFQKEGKGFYRTSVTDAAAFTEEAFMPPEDQVRAWVLVYYSESDEVDAEEFWRSYSMVRGISYERSMQVDRAVKDKATELIAGAASEDQKVRRIFDYCVQEIRSVFHDRGRRSSEDQDGFEANEGPRDTIEKGLGTSDDIRLLFGALLSAAGLEVRAAVMAPRDEVFFNPTSPHSYFLSSFVMAARLGGEWEFYDPGSPYVARGSLSWTQQGVQALVLDPESPQWIKTPLDGPEKNLASRSASFALSPDGTLDGQVRYEFSGASGVEHKRFHDGLAESERVEYVENLVKDRLSNAEVSEVQVLNADSITQNISYIFRVKVLNYAAATGRRLILQPSFFETNAKPRFASSSRVHDIYFKYPWTETDSITIELPEGYELEDAESPQSSTVQDVGHNRLKLAVQGGDRLVLAREFQWGQGGNILFPVSTYQQIKGAFDFMHQQDQHAVTLRRIDGESSDGAP